MFLPVCQSFAWNEQLSTVHMTDESTIMCSLSQSATLRTEMRGSRAFPPPVWRRVQPGYASRALICRLNGAGGVLGVGRKLPLARHCTEGKHELRLPGDRRGEGQSRAEGRRPCCCCCCLTLGWPEERPGQRLCWHLWATSSPYVD